MKIVFEWVMWIKWADQGTAGIRGRCPRKIFAEMHFLRCNFGGGGTFFCFLFCLGRERFLKQKYEKTSKYFNKRVFCLVFCFLLLFFSEKEKKLKNCFFVFFFRIQVHFYAVFLNGQRSTMYVKYLQFFIIISSLLKAKNYEIFESNLSRMKYSSTLPLCHSNSWLHYILNQWDNFSKKNSKKRSEHKSQTTYKILQFVNCIGHIIKFQPKLQFGLSFFQVPTGPHQKSFRYYFWHNSWYYLRIS